MKKYAFYPGCMISTEQYAYELSIRETLPLLDIELIDINGFSCCGGPMKSMNQLMTLYLSARNIAIGEREGLNLYAPCAICHHALSECIHVLDNDEDMKKRINEVLADENLNYKGTVNIVHTVDLLYDHIGIEEIRKKVKTPLGNIKIATHYGCHLIRPYELGRPVDSENPKKMEEILKALGAKTPDYPEKLDCCGGIVQFNHLESALTKTGQKLKAVKDRGFDGFVDVCPWCHKMFDSRQNKAGETIATKLEVPVFYLTQLLGLALGVKGEKLGLDLNLTPVDKLKIGV